MPWHPGDVSCAHIGPGLPTASLSFGRAPWGPPRPWLMRQDMCAWPLPGHLPLFLGGCPESFSPPLRTRLPAPPRATGVQLQAVTLSSSTSWLLSNLAPWFSRCTVTWSLLFWCHLVGKGTWVADTPVLLLLVSVKVINCLNVKVTCASWPDESVSLTDAQPRLVILTCSCCRAVRTEVRGRSRSQAAHEAHCLLPGSL